MSKIEGTVIELRRVYDLVHGERQSMMKTHGFVAVVAVSRGALHSQIEIPVQEEDDVHLRDVVDIEMTFRRRL